MNMSDRTMTREAWEALRYPVKLHPLSDEEGGGWLATIPLLGEATCVADGETVEEALESLEAYRRSLYEHLMQTGIAVPLPPMRPDAATARPSGKWVQRVTPELHAQLQSAAQQAGVSFNTYCLSCLERGQQANAAQTTVRAEFSRLKHELTVHLSEELRRELRAEMRQQIHSSLHRAAFASARATFENASIHVERPAFKMNRPRRARAQLALVPQSALQAA